jgi:catalase
VFTANGRKAGIYILPGFDYTTVSALQKELMAAGMMAMIVAPATGPIKSASGQTLDAQFTFENSRSTYFDCVVFPGGPDEAYAKKFKMGRLVHVVREQYMHLKTIGATGNAIPWVADMCLPGEFSENVKTSSSVVQENGCVFTTSFGTGAEFAKTYIEGVAQHRCWDREVSHIAA